MALRFSPSRGAASFALSSAIRGIPGVDGDDGAAATIAVGSTSTLAAGASATASNGGSSSAASLVFGIPRGADAGMRYAFESSTSMAAPASGGVRLNNATLASVTAMAVNATNSDGIDVSDFVATWDDSTSSTKGTVVVRKEGSGAVLAVYTIGTVTDNTTWLQVALTYVSGSGSFAAADPVYLTPNLTGNKGTDGLGTGDVVGPAASVDSEVALYDSTTGKLIKRASITGIAKLTSGVLSAATSNTDYLPVASPVMTTPTLGVATATSVNKMAITAPATSSTLAVADGKTFTSSNTITLAAGADSQTWTFPSSSSTVLTVGNTATLTAGYITTSYSLGTVTTGTVTPSVANGFFQHLTANGAFTLAPPSGACCIDIEVLNGASAGTITTSGFTKVNGDAYATTNANKYIFHVEKTNGYSRLSVEALQ